MEKFIGFRASEREDSAVDELGKKFGISKSEVTRRAIRSFAAQHGIELPGVTA